MKVFVVLTRTGWSDEAAFMVMDMRARDRTRGDLGRVVSKASRSGPLVLSPRSAILKSRYLCDGSSTRGNMLLHAREHDVTQLGGRERTRETGENKKTIRSAIFLRRMDYYSLPEGRVLFKVGAGRKGKHPLGQRPLLSPVARVPEHGGHRAAAGGDHEGG